MVGYPGDMLACVDARWSPRIGDPTAIGRCDAQLRGWYADRRAFQFGFVIAIAAGAVALAGWLAWRLRRVFGRLRIAILGVALLLGFVLVRAVGFHHFDEMIGMRVAGWRLNWIFELVGIGLVAIGAVGALASPPARRRA